jgi:menaquinone-9 beta-reductase
MPGAARDQRDIVVVGGGIAGSALAARLARAGRRVTVVETRAEYDDRVRGEGIVPWGVREAKAAGALDVLVAAGAARMRSFVAYEIGQRPDIAEATAVRLDGLVEGTGGGLAIRHPVACAALSDNARRAGAEVILGYERLDLDGDGTIIVTLPDGRVVVRSAELIVGADGRASQVRRHAGIELHRRQSAHFVAGALVVVSPPPGPAAMTTSVDRDRYLIAFAQGDGTTRVYLCGDASDLRRYGGSDGADHFLEDLRRHSLPSPRAWTAARSVGPCKAVTGDDAYVETTHRDRAVLVGDAAGYASPITGQGLSLALADVNDVSRAILEADGSRPNFDAYAARKRRRLDVVRWGTEISAAVHAERCADREARLAALRRAARRNPTVRTGLAASLVGPHTVDPDDLPWPAIDELRTVAAV